MKTKSKISKENMGPFSGLWIRKSFMAFGICAGVLLPQEKAEAQNLSVHLVPHTYPGGYNISCHGLMDGKLTANVQDGVPPYTFVWSNAGSTYQQENLPAGTYQVTVQDANGATGIASFELIQPSLLTSQEQHSDYFGYGVSSFGGSNGFIQMNVSGGSTPYSYLWSNGSTSSEISNLEAGGYTCFVQDANGCSISQQVTLSQPLELQATVSNIQHISCNGSNDGKAELSISGGIAPYTIQWDNGNFVTHPDNLLPGENKVKVMDAAGDASVMLSIQIQEPPVLQIVLATSSYPPNGYEVSCSGCSDGTVTATVQGGTPPYLFQWNDPAGTTLPALLNLPSGNYKLWVSDQNGCESQGDAMLNAPPQADWSQTGNAGSDPSVQYIGTSDMIDFKLKSNNQTNIRLTPTETVFEKPIKLNSLASSGNGPFKSLVTDLAGNVSSMGDVSYIDTDDVFTYYCNTSNALFPWQHPQLFDPATQQVVPNSLDNTQILPCPDLNVGVGFKKVPPYMKFAVKGNAMFTNYVSIGQNAFTPQHLLTVNGTGVFNDKLTATGFQVNGNSFLDGELVTTRDVTHFDYNNQSKIKIALDGANGAIDFYPASGAVGRLSLNYGSQMDVLVGHNLSVNGIINSCKVVVETAQWCDYVFEDNYQLLPLKKLEEFYTTNKHLPNIPKATDIMSTGLNLGEIQMLQMEKIEEIVRYLVELKHENEALTARVEALNKLITK